MTKSNGTQAGEDTLPEQPDGPTTEERDPEQRGMFGIKPIKFVFAMEYVLQGLANPFQGITYQPFFRHFRFDYGLSEAATQSFFSQSYLAWSFKPLIGFLIDAYGRTKTILTVLLSLIVIGYLVSPIVDRSAALFFWFMFSLSIIMASTDVAVDRATVITGDEEARETGKSKSTTVGLNQAICWMAIYGTGIFAAVMGGWIADNLAFDLLLVLLAIVPALVLLVVLMLPKDKATPIPLKESVRGFWQGLHTGPILWVMLFFFVFHFQPAMGALWTNYLIESLAFTQTQIGIADGATYIGYFVGVVLFASVGVHWQEKLGLRKLFRYYIIASVAINLTQYLLVDPWFSGITRGLHALLPFLEEDTVRLGFLAGYNALLAVGISIIRMSTFSLVGAVIPVAAAGSLFAGFMSINNLAYSFSYASGAWIYEHGLEFGLVRGIQQLLFGIPGVAGGELSINMLILIGSLAYLLSFVATKMLPDRRETLAAHDEDTVHAGTERWLVLPVPLRRTIDWMVLGVGALVFLVLCWSWGFGLGNIISALLMCFFGFTFLRKLVLDSLLRRQAV